MSPETIRSVAPYVLIGIIIGTIMGVVPMLVWLERKLMAFFQVRVGPNRVGPHGLLQAFADGIKMLAKEDIMPAHVDKFLYLAAPVVLMIPALSVFAVVPFGPGVRIGDVEIKLVIADIPVAILLILALTSLGVYGIVLAGWASNNKYSLLGGLRASAQMVSYELPMGLALVSGLMIASAYVPESTLGSLRLTQIVDSQAGGIHHWNAFRWGPIGLLALLIYFICGLAETNRAPFDLPEAETELVAGYHTEYSSMKFGMFFLAEYANMVNVAAVATVLFLGGWRSPFEFIGGGVTMAGGGDYYGWVAALLGVLWFVTKLFLIMCIYIWLRSTLPRLRYDQLMSFAWKRLLPVSLVLIMVVAIILTVFYPAPDAITMGSRADSSPVAQPLRGQ